MRTRERERELDGPFPLFFFGGLLRKPAENWAEMPLMPLSKGGLQSAFLRDMTQATPPRFSQTYTTSFSNGRLHEVEVQVLLRSGLPRFDIIGLPQNTIREGKDRILSALGSLGLELPNQRILVSLNPADLPKEGSHFDLSIFAGVLNAMGVRLHDPAQKEFFWGQLLLDGRIRTFEEWLGHLLFASLKKPKQCFMARPLDGSDRWGVPCEVSQNLNHVRDLIVGSEAVDAVRAPDITDSLILEDWLRSVPEDSSFERLDKTESLLNLWGMIAVGRLNVLFEGPPGTGKSTWCHLFSDFQLPLLKETWKERFIFQPQESSRCRSFQDVFRAPFQSPHHKSSATAIVGGGTSKIQTGAISRAHQGCLFMDEFNEFSRDVVEALREPLEFKKITIARGARQETFETDIQVLAAMNPCACGFYRSKKVCRCTTAAFRQFQNKISGPIRDRFHLQVWWDREEGSPLIKTSLKDFRTRIVETARRPTPSLNSQNLPQFENFRRQKKWLEGLYAFAKWHGISKIGHNELKSYETFRTKWQRADEYTTNSTAIP